MKPAPVKELISFDDFGDHTRSILAGIKQERENPKEIEKREMAQEQDNR